MKFQVLPSVLFVRYSFEVTHLVLFYCSVVNWDEAADALPRTGWEALKATVELGITGQRLTPRLPMAVLGHTTLILTTRLPFWQSSPVPMRLAFYHPSQPHWLASHRLFTYHPCAAQDKQPAATSAYRTLDIQQARWAGQGKREYNGL